MRNNNIIIIALIVIVLIVLGVFVFTHLPSASHDGKMNTQIDFLSQSTLKNGEAVQFLLKDEQNNALGTQNITITFVENGVNQTYSVITDNEGKASLVLNNENPGSYDVIVSYNGTAKYNGCSAKQTITVEEGAAETTQSSDSGSQPATQSNSSAGTSMYNNGNSSSSSAQLYYDSQYNFYYDQNGIIRGGQNDGYSAEYIRNVYEHGDLVDAEGNLQ